jgi:hypothetical protein
MGLVTQSVVCISLSNIQATTVYLELQIIRQTHLCKPPQGGVRSTRRIDCTCTADRAFCRAQRRAQCNRCGRLGETLCYILSGRFLRVCLYALSDQNIRVSCLE